jgi:hypothetical protein
MTTALAPIAAAFFFWNGISDGKKDTAESGKKLLKRKKLEDGCRKLYTGYRL